MPQTWRMNPGQPPGALDADTLAGGEAGAAPLALPLFHEAEQTKDQMEQAIWENGLITGAVTRPATKTFAEPGYTPQEMASRMPDLYGLSHPDGVEVLRQAVRDHPSGVTPQYRCEFRLRSRQGLWVWFTNDDRTMDSHNRNTGAPLDCCQTHLIRYMSQTHLPQPFGLSLSKPGRSLQAALRQAQGERVYLRYVANQASSTSTITSAPGVPGLTHRPVPSAHAHAYQWCRVPTRRALWPPFVCPCGRYRLPQSGQRRLGAPGGPPHDLCDGPGPPGAPRCRGRHRGPVQGQGVRDRVARDGQAGGLEIRRVLTPRTAKWRP